MKTLSESRRTPAAFLIAVILAVSTYARVTIIDSTVTWHANSYTMSADYGLLSAQANTSVAKTINCKVIENEYLRIVVESDFGARIISMVYKPTNHEELYTSPGGVPYGIKEGSFYYDWLMVYSGIMPTFSEPEHGKFWVRPWTYTLVKKNDDTVSIAMSQKDTIDFPNKPAKFAYGVTGIECVFTVTLVSGKSSLDVEVLLTNPSGQQKNYEYWTMTTLAPGSSKDNPRTTAGAEIVANVKKVNIPPYWAAIRGQEQSMGGDIYSFNKLRLWKNWTDMGIAYGWPDASSPLNTFWGVINHDNEEGIIRVSDNDQTIGLKIWSWSYGKSVNSNSGTNLPYLELWAGVSKMFFSPDHFPANGQKRWKEHFIPTVKLTNVTHANENVVCNVAADKTTYNTATDAKVDVTAQLFFTSPGQKINLAVSFDGARLQSVFDSVITADPLGNSIARSVPMTSLCGGLTKISLKATTAQNSELLNVSIPVTITGAQNCAGTLRQPDPAIHSGAFGRRNIRLYRIDGRCIGEYRSPGTRIIKGPAPGIYLIGESGDVPGIKLLRKKYMIRSSL